MSAKSLQLKGNNLCNIECVDKNSVIHPETDIENIITNESSEQTLEDWLLYDYHHPSTPFDSIKNGLLEWLETNYPIPSIELPVASTTTLGAIKVGNFLNIDGGVLSVNKNSLEIPSIESASYNTKGIVNLGNNTVLPEDFSESPISYTSYHLFPLRIDSKGKAGIEIDDSVVPSLQEQADWNQVLSNQPSYIKNKPNLARVALTGNYADLSGKPVATTVPIRLADDNWIMAGISQHYFKIQKPDVLSESEVFRYVPLFKIQRSELDNTFKVNLRFEIIGRYETTYYGDYMLNYNTDTGYLMTLNSIASPRLEADDIIVVTNRINDVINKIIVYKKIFYTRTGEISSRTFFNPESFIVNMLSINTIFDITYYCSAKISVNDNETELGTETDPDSSIVTTTLTSDLPYIPALQP